MSVPETDLRLGGYAASACVAKLVAPFSERLAVDKRPKPA